MASISRHRDMVLVAAALVVLFGATELLARGYRAARNERAETHARRGQALKQEGRYAEAADEYRAALSFSPHVFTYRLSLAASLMSLKDWREASRHLAELRETDPTSGAVNLMLARIESAENQPEAAEAAYQRAIFGYWPEDPRGNRLRARFELIDLYDRMGERNKLLSELLEAAAEAPPEPELRNQVGRLLLRHGAEEQAVEAFRESTRLDEKDPGAWVGLGEAARAMGNYRTAVSAFRAAQRRAPEDKNVARLLVETARAMDLDPTGVRLGAAERNRRSRELVRRAIAQIETCGDLSPAARGVAELARGALAIRHRGEDDTPQMLALAEELWHVRAPGCKAAQGDAALELVMARVGRDERP